MRSASNDFIKSTVCDCEKKRAVRITSEQEAKINTAVGICMCVLFAHFVSVVKH